jgi:hypothetical protein
MFSPKVVISRNANSSVTQMSSNVTSIGSSAGSVICQLPNNASAIGAASLSSNTQISFSGEPVGQTGPTGPTCSTGPTGATGPTFFITGITGPKPDIIKENPIILEEKVATNGCCVKWF